MLQRSLELLDADFLRQVCFEGTHETQRLEFKRALPATDDRLELLKDIAALANADGGDLVYGIGEVAGAASILCPLPGGELDRARRRISQALDSIEPRVNGVKVQPVLVDEGAVLVVRIPASFDGPHSYRTEGGARRFVIRNGTDTSDMNIQQIQLAFDRTATLSQQASQIIHDRFEAISAGKTWRRFFQGPICVFAAVPLSGLTGRAAVDIAALNAQGFGRFAPVEGLGLSRSMNLDGLVIHPSVASDGIRAYTEVHRTGAVFSLLSGGGRDEKTVPSAFVTKFFRSAFATQLGALRSIAVTGAAVVQCALLRVPGCKMVGRDGHGFATESAEIDRPHLVLPATWIDAVEEPLDSSEVDDQVRPMMDVLWQAFDMDRCTEFGEDGSWQPSLR